MIKPSQLIAMFQKALNEGWGYILNKAGAIWTQADQKAATDPMAIQYGSKWIGKHVADCSGLFSWAFKALGGYMYHGSNTMWKKYTTAKGSLKSGKRTDGQTLKPGSAVFRFKYPDDRYHVGLYIGNGKVIEAKGTRYGVVESKVATWDEWAELKGVNYTVENSQQQEQSVPAPAEEINLRLGDRTLKKTSPCMEGTDIYELQTRLTALGYDPGSPDGIFGTRTRAAVLALQKAAGIARDGIFGKNSMAALEAQEKAKTGQQTQSTYTVTISGLDGKAADALLANYPTATKTKE